MAVHLGGIYSKPSGKAGSLVWGRARTLYGKLATSRAWVIPTNPNTSDQQDRRAIFAAANTIASNLGSGVWQNAWDRTLGDLPGFQAMMSWQIYALQRVAGIISYRDDLPEHSLGPAYRPEWFDVREGDNSGEVKLQWYKTCQGDHCSVADILQAWCVEKTSPEEAVITMTQGVSPIRDDEVWTVAGKTPGEDYTMVGWFIHYNAGLDIYEYSPLMSGYAAAKA